jgi:prepilin-type N-terminal cleavage/methylation domain-containing protein
MKQIHSNQSGFSLLEMLLVLAILSLVLGVTMTAINDVQKRSRVEEARVDLTQESREFVEQMVRDLHQSGYPTSIMYTTPKIDPTDQNWARGLLTGTTTSVSFEGDVDGDGVVDFVQYQLVSAPGSPAGQCPCVLQRGSIAKVTGTAVAPGAFPNEVDQVINSAGGVNGANAWVIAGDTQGVLHDTRYQTYKVDPIFRYYDQFGGELTPAAGGAFTTATGSAAGIADVRAIRIQVNTLSSVVDPVSNTFPTGSMTASARIANK